MRRWANYAKVGRGGVELRIETAERVVNGRALEYPDATTAALEELEHLSLDDDAHAFEEEHAAKQGDEEFFVDDDGQHADDSAMVSEPVSPINTWAG